MTKPAKPTLSSSEKWFLNALADRLEEVSNFEKRTEAIRAKNEGVIEYQEAVKIAAQGLSAAGIELKRNSPGAQFFEGQIEAGKHFHPEHGWGEEEASVFISKASTHHPSYLALKFILQITPTEGLPKNLKDWSRSLYLETFTPPKKPPGKFAYAMFHRDLLVVRQVKMLAKNGFFPTRSKRPASGQSACDVVADALSLNGEGIGYDAVETIWLNRTKIPKNHILAEYTNHVLSITPSMNSTIDSED